MDDVTVYRDEFSFVWRLQPPHFFACGRLRSFALAGSSKPAGWMVSPKAFKGARLTHLSANTFPLVLLEKKAKLPAQEARAW